MNEQLPDRQALGKEQKAGFALLLLFGVMAIGLGFLQMRNNIYGPFAYKAPAQAGFTTEDIIEDETVRLQSIDTDQDGVNDYEELYFYQTSPYIPDTDSDGYTDKEELDAGEDPNCPRGQDCGGSEAFVLNNSTSSPTDVGDAPSINSPLDILGQVNTDISAGRQTDLTQVVGDVDAIRELILQTGKLSKEQLDALDDQTILNLVVEILAEENGGEGPPAAAEANPTTSSPE